MIPDNLCDAIFTLRRPLLIVKKRCCNVLSAREVSETIADKNLEILFRSRSCNGKANKFPQISFACVFVMIMLGTHKQMAKAERAYIASIHQSAERRLFSMGVVLFFFTLETTRTMEPRDDNLKTTPF